MDEKLNYEQIKCEILELLRSNDHVMEFFKFLRERKRTSRLSDVNQLILSVKKEGFMATRGDIIQTLKLFDKVGIGRFEVDSSDKQFRQKFKWEYWVFPLLNKQSKLIEAFEFKSMSLFENDRNQLHNVKQQLKIYEDTLPNAHMLEGTRHRYDVLLRDSYPSAAPATNNDHGDISKLSLETLTQELERRGWNITLTKTNKGGRP